MKKHKHMAIRVGVSAALVSVGIELFQFLTALGLCDIDDVILNVVGAMLGYCIYRLANIFFERKR